MSSRVIAVVSASSRCGARPQRSATFATNPGAKPPSLRRSVGSIATTKPSAVATCTFQAGATAPSASRINRASGSLTETLGSPLLASSVACVLARAAFSCSNSASFCRARATPLGPLLGCLQSSLLALPFRLRWAGSPGSVSSSLFNSATRSATACSTRSSRLGLHIEPRPAQAPPPLSQGQALGPVNCQLFQGDQLFGDQSGHALGQQAIQQHRIRAPKLRQQIVIDRRPAA